MSGWRLTDVELAQIREEYDGPEDGYRIGEAQVIWSLLQHIDALELQLADLYRVAVAASNVLHALGYPVERIAVPPSVRRMLSEQEGR